MTTWNDIFEPVKKFSGNLEERPQQALLGQEIIDTLQDGGVLLGNAPTGSGKSFATLVPAIDYVKRTRKQVVFSVTTLALQDQISKKDLPFLFKVYGGFTYAVLKGRGQYLCLNNMKQMTMGDPKLNSLYMKLDGAGLATGERAEVEARVGKVDDLVWSKMCGESQRCSEMNCDEAKCYGVKARSKAVGKDIVVVNHSVLIANHESKKFGGGFLGAEGDFPVLMVDEAHELENSIIGFLSTRVNKWELNTLQGAITKGVASAVERGLYPINERKVTGALDRLNDNFDFLIQFYHGLCTYEGREWDKETTKITKKVVSVRAPENIKAMGRRFSGTMLDEMFEDLQTLHQTYGQLKASWEKAVALDDGKLRVLTKAMNKANDLYMYMKKIFEACDTSQGYSMDYGTPYGVILNGYHNRDGDVMGSLHITPLEVSAYAEQMFAGKTCIFVSATLKDISAPSGKEFNYFVQSMGLDSKTVQTLDLEAVFDYGSQQLVYISGNTYSIGGNRLGGVKYSLEELYDLIMAAKGRTLVLFTSNAELEEALQYLSQTGIPYPLYAQGGSMDKQELVDSFMSEKNSVLLGSKSFFTGVDFHGEACSLVVLVKFPNPRFDDLCKLRLNWWSKKGYRNWYEMEALSVFQQGAGRLIRKGDDFGVVAVLDKRATDPNEKVYASVGKGVTAMGSSVTRDIKDVKNFLGGKR